jgi:hypothetical protein
VDVVGLAAIVTADGSRLGIFVAWTYVGLRMVHSLIHLTYNHVLHRLFAFTLSNVALVSLWVIAGVHVAPIRAA